MPEDTSEGTTIGTVAASDPDGDALTYSIGFQYGECNVWGCETCLVLLPAGDWESMVPGSPFAIDDSGNITLNNELDHEHYSGYLLSVVVGDGEWNTTADGHVWVSDVDEAPDVSNPGDQTSVEGETIQPLQINAFDEDHPQSHGLSYSATGLPEGLNIDCYTGVISGTVAYDAAETNGGTYDVEITVTDTSTLVGTTSFTWTVTNAAIGTLIGTKQENGADTTNSITVAGTSSNAITVLQGNEVALTLTPGAEGTLPAGGDIRYRADAIGAVTQTGTFATTPLITPMSGELTTILVGIDLNGDGILQQETEVTHSFVAMCDYHAPVIVIDVYDDGDLITIDASSSFDPDGDALYFAWTEGGEVYSTENAIDFLPYELSLYWWERGTSLQFTLEVSDGTNSDTCLISYEYEDAGSDPPDGDPATGPTDWQKWSDAEDDLDVSGSTNEGFVRNALSSLGGKYALSTIPTLEPGQQAPAFQNLSRDKAVTVKILISGPVFQSRESRVPLCKFSEAARLQIRVNLQNLKQDIVDKVDALLQATPPRSGGQPVTLTAAQRADAANRFADIYIRAVDDFLRTHPGAKASLGARNTFLNWLGLSNEYTDPWCADWALGMFQNVVYAVRNPANQIHQVLDGADAQATWGSGAHEHNWVVIYPKETIPAESLTPTQAMQDKMLYADPWPSLMPKLCTDEEHEGLTEQDNELDMINQGFD